MLFYKNGEGPREIVSYLTLRKAVGMLGILLPVLVAVVCWILGPCTGIQESISVYYATHARDLFVGILFAIAWFLFAYRGHEPKDDFAGDIACAFALGVALFPATSANAWIRSVHFISASGLFLVLSYFSLVLFTKTGSSPTDQKKNRNVLFKACGVVMLVCIGLIALYYSVLSDTSLAALKPVFWLESFALWAFGLSWMTKGRMLLRDGKQAS